MRMEERYGYKDLTESEYLEMCKLCPEGKKIKAEFTKKGYQYICRIFFKGMPVIVVYTSWTRQVNTVLPYEHFKRKGSQYGSIRTKGNSK